MTNMNLSSLCRFEKFCYPADTSMSSGGPHLSAIEVPEATGEAQPLESRVLPMQHLPRATRPALETRSQPALNIKYSLRA